jgi:hypothetical protein
MTEIDEHAKKSRLKTIVKSGTVDGDLGNYKRDVEQGVKTTFGVASQQSFLAVKTALERRLDQGNDGTPDQQKVALGQLPPHGRSTWYKFVDRFAQI